MKSTVAFINGCVITAERLLNDGVVLCEGGRIKAVGSRSKIRFPRNATTIDAQGGYISPGFVDIHVHGGAGADFMDGTVEAVRTAVRAHTRHGTTTIFPTTTTGSPKQITAMLRACQRAQQDWSIDHGARIGGVHFYGPYFAEDKVGCHLKSGRRNPDAREYLKAFDLGIVKVATCAAELPGAEEFYREASKRGCLVTCGHSNASWTEMQRAFDAGMRHVDHFWCAMSSVASLRGRFGTPMQASMEQFVLAKKEMSTEVIADGCHLSPELLQFAATMIGPDRLCLVTDCNRALDMPPGRYRFGPKSDGESFESDGRVGFIPGGALASSVKGLDTMVRTMMDNTDIGIVDAVKMASLTPARRVGMEKEIGSLKIGNCANVIVLNQELQVQRVFVNGAEFIA